MKSYTCPVAGCGKDAKFLRMMAEEALMGINENIEDLPKSAKGHPLPKAVQRNIAIECPVHGEQWIQHRGHHISVGASKRSKKAKNVSVQPKPTP